MPSLGSVTPQFRQLISNLEYAERMVAVGEHMKAEEDLYRAAWVQAVAALDHWVHQEVYERATAIAMNSTAGRSKRFNAFEIPWGRVEEIHNQGRRMEDVFREVLEERLGHESYQSTRRIGEAFSLLLHHISAATMWQRAAKHLDDAGHSPGLTKEQLVAYHDGIIVRRRNQIAHESDINPATGKRRPLTRQETAEAVTWIRHLAEALTSTIR
ncbi:hypothetical protein [Kitasatospora sp. NPDC088346]|uniref:hypothetical protein n=1 Tax=Kitasatospora sp. NPDC088346 TaxID=3364073 RepID=UPI0038181E07